MEDQVEQISDLDLRLILYSLTSELLVLRGYYQVFRRLHHFTLSPLPRPLHQHCRNRSFLSSFQYKLTYFLQEPALESQVIAVTSFLLLLALH